MKKQSIILILFLLFKFPFSEAQVVEENRSMSQGNHTAYIIEIQNTNEKFVENIWKKHLKSFGGKSKKSWNAKEVFTESAKISAIGKGGEINLYTTFEQVGDNVSLSMWVDLGNEFLSKNNNNNQIQGAKYFLEDFSKEIRREIIRLQVKEQKNVLQKFEANLKKLERDNLRLEREIEIAEAKILKNKAKLEENRIAKEESMRNIEMQRITLDSIKSLSNN